MPAGRKPTPIDLKQLESLAMMHCTDEEIAGFFGISKRQFERRKEDADVREVWERGRAKGRISIRRKQMEMLNAGNATMAIWLGKQLLRQKDVVTNEHSGPNGTPIKVEDTTDLKSLPKEKLLQLREILAGAQKPAAP